MTDERAAEAAVTGERPPQAEAAAAPPEPARERPPVRRPAAPKPKRRRGAPVTDPVADMLTRVRNAVGARHEAVALPESRMRAEIARILKDEGFIGGFERSDGQLTLRLKYVGGKVPALAGIRRISRPGLRVYARRTEMPRVLGGLGISIVSTSSGLMTGREAERRGLGGEVLAHVW